MSEQVNLNAIARLVPEGSRVLDLGCGDGALIDLGYCGQNDIILVIHHRI